MEVFLNLIWLVLVLLLVSSPSHESQVETQIEYPIDLGTENIFPVSEETECLTYPAIALAPIPVLNEAVLVAEAYVTDGLSGMTLKALKLEAKERGLTGYSRLKKAELLELLRA